jgi:hypothetical protein
MRIHDAALKDYYRNRIHDTQREANRLAIQVELDAHDVEDVRTLADAADCLEAAVKVLTAARSQLTTA